MLNEAIDALEDARDTLENVSITLKEAEGAASEAQAVLEHLSSGAQPIWQDSGCHRSAFSAQAQAALALERLDARSSVTFVHAACSGAKTGAVPGQIESALSLVGSRSIDAVVLSIGGNDAGFSSIIKSLIRHRSASGLDVDFDALQLVEALCPLIPA